MTDQAQNLYDVLDDRFTKLDAAVAKVKAGADLAARKKEEREARKVYYDARKDVNSFRSAVSKIDDPIQRSGFQRKYATFNDRLTAADKELKSLVTAPRRNAAAAAVSAEQRKVEEIMGEGGAAGDRFESSEQVMQAANRAQDDINLTLMRANRMALTIEDTGNAVLVELQKQTEKMYQIDKELATLDTHLKRAKKEVQWFFRRMAMDKLCISLILVILLGAVVLIFWRIYSRRSGKSLNPLDLIPTSNQTTTTATSTAAPVFTLPPPTTTTGVIIIGERVGEALQRLLERP
jgi:hypothetical protein